MHQSKNPPALRLSTRPVKMFSRMYTCMSAAGETLSKITLPSNPVTQGGVTQVDKCLCKFMTSTLLELNPLRLAPHLQLLMMFLGVSVMDPYPIWHCTVQQKHGSCHQDFIVFSFLACVRDHRNTI